MKYVDSVRTGTKLLAYKFVVCDSKIDINNQRVFEILECILVPIDYYSRKIKNQTVSLR